MEETVRDMGQAYAGVGSPDPRLNTHGTIDFRLTSLYQSWAKYDDPPSRVKPLPLSLLINTVRLARHESTVTAQAAADVLLIGYFFLLRPGEYLGTPNDALGTLFRLRDLTLWVGSRALDHQACPVADLHSATFATLTFTRHKNGVRNENVGHGRYGDPLVCPVLALASRVCALRDLYAPLSTPLNAYAATPGAPHRHVLAGNLTRRLRLALAIHPHPAYAAKDISAHSTRAGGAMALFCAGVGAERIKLVGRWRSDELFRYLHVQTQPVMTGLSAAMLRGGSFGMAPG